MTISNTVTATRVALADINLSILGVDAIVEKNALKLADVEAKLSGTEKLVSGDFPESGSDERNSLLLCSHP